MVIEDTLVKMAQALNRVTDEEPHVTDSDNKDNFDMRHQSKRIGILQNTNQMIQSI